MVVAASRLFYCRKWDFFSFSRCTYIILFVMCNTGQNPAFLLMKGDAKAQWDSQPKSKKTHHQLNTPKRQLSDVHRWAEASKPLSTGENKEKSLQKQSESQPDLSPWNCTSTGCTQFYIKWVIPTWKKSVRSLKKSANALAVHVRFKLQPLLIKPSI